MTARLLIPFSLCGWRATAALWMLLQVSAPAAALPEQTAEQLAADARWLRLLHIPRVGHPSDILSQDFFLSERGRTDAAAELRATLAAYAQPWPDDPNQHARCRFPARYLWLSQHVDLPGYVRRDTRCQRFEQWARLDQVRSISVLLISGYFGNPASTFGHALIKLNTGPETAASGLLDVSINYGALVPDNELVLLYVLRGLTGGYEAGFSDKLHYTNDLVYARTEFRDVWDYELRLDASARELLVMHLWEIVGRKFTYYFLTENCAYRLAELLELATGLPLLARSSVWFIPVELFHRLDDAQSVDDSSLVDSVRFVPSAERSLRHRLAAQSPAEAAAMSASIANGATDLPVRLASLPADQVPGVLNTLLAYYEYLRAATSPATGPDVQQAKDRVLRHRLSLPASNVVETPMAPLASPGSAAAPMVVAVGVGHAAQSGSFVRARWAPVSYDFASFNALEAGEMTVLDIVADIGEQGSAKLERLDLVRVRKLNANRMRVPLESTLSWQTRIGVRREIREGTSHSDTFAAFGVGQATGWSASLLAYAMLDALIQSAPSRLAVEPSLGLVSRQANWRGSIVLGARHDIGQHRWQRGLNVSLSHRLSQHQSISLDVKQDQQVRAVLSINRHW